MKKNLLFLMGAALPCALIGQTYCTPPPFYTGPYTGITNVTIGTLNHNSGDWDGVTYYEEVAAPQLSRGSTYILSVTTQHNLIGAFSGNLNTHAWIDWNQDGDFEDDDENVYKVDDQFKGTYTSNVTVPAHAKTGITRMRVYEDMPAYEGHEYPHPCGYAQYPGNFLGHHGESEDYNVEVTGSATGIDEGVLNETHFNVYTSHGILEAAYRLNRPADVVMEVYNALGQKLLQKTTNGQNAGLYTVKLEGMETAGEQFVIVHLRANEQFLSRKVIR